VIPIIAVPVVVPPVVVPISSVTVPPMIVLELPVVAGPVTRVKLLSFIARTDPLSSFKRRPRIVSVMPRIPVV